MTDGLQLMGMRLGAVMLPVYFQGGCLPQHQAVWWVNKVRGVQLYLYVAMPVAEGTHRQLAHTTTAFDTVTLMGNVTPDPPELPKWRHHIETAIDLKALGLLVAKVFIDDSPSAVLICPSVGAVG